jgi:hypothetical protein
MPASFPCRCVLAILLAGSTAAWAGTYDGGAGTVDNPYLLGSVADWQELADTPDDWASHFLMVADLDFGGGAIPQVSIDPNPLYGHQGTPFTGVFDGGGFALRNGTVGVVGASPDHIALIGKVELGGIIRNLRAEDIAVTGEDFCSILVSYLEQGTIENCHVTGSVTGNDNVGGLVGETWQGVIDDCSSAAEVNGVETGGWDPSYTGGLLGYNNEGTVRMSHATGAVVGMEFVGGLIGYSYGTVERSYATGAVVGTESVGGLMGGSGGPASDSYAQGAVTGTDYVGGLFGFDTAATTNCYATGLITCPGANRGGFTGWTHATESVVTACFWDTETTLQPASPAGTAKNTAEMQTEATFTDWDFAAIWSISPGEYPRLRPTAYVVTFRTDGTPGATLTGGVTELTQTVARGGDTTPVEAIPEVDGLPFLGWTGALESFDNPLTVTGVTGPMTLTATFGDPLAVGARLDIAAADIDLAEFKVKPKAYAVFAHPVSGKQGQKAGIKILTKVSPKPPAETAIVGEWTKKIGLYNKKTFAAAQKAGEGAASWLNYAPNQQPLLMALQVASKEALPIDRKIRSVQLQPPVIDQIDDNGDGTLTVAGAWFGVKKPKAWREYTVPGKDGGTVVKRQALKVLVDPAAGFLDGKGKPACMNPEDGASQVLLVIPAKEPKGDRAIDTIVIENGVGLAVGDDPTWTP